jgi:hypothetical protein
MMARSTADVKTGKAQNEQVFSSSSAISDARSQRTKRAPMRAPSDFCENDELYQKW